MPVDRLEPRRLFASGLFAPPQVYGDVAGTGLLTTGDFDGNGTVDVVGVGLYRTDNPPLDGFLCGLMNDGAGRFDDFVSPGTPGTFGRPARVLAAHLNDDAHEDVVVFHLLPGDELFLLTTHLSDGAGRFEQSTDPLPVPVTRRSAFATGDFDHDGRRELAADRFILYRAGGAFVPLDTNAPVAGLPVDVNGDGWTDLFDRGGVRLNDGAGRLLPEAPYAGGGAFRGHPAGQGHGGGTLNGYAAPRTSATSTATATLTSSAAAAAPTSRCR